MSGKHQKGFAGPACLFFSSRRSRFSQVEKLTPRTPLLLPLSIVRNKVKQCLRGKCATRLTDCVGRRDGRDSCGPREPAGCSPPTGWRSVLFSGVHFTFYRSARPLVEEQRNDQ
eukprot:scaffold5974_cov158-Ochromonas_danica.AAC.10